MRTVSLIFSLIVLSVLSGSPAPQRASTELPNKSPWLRFFQPHALSDFDNDDKLDLATVSRSGLSECVEIYLSRTGKSSFLQFNARSENGSLFARDLDKDGDADLIWTDLLHPDDVIVWLGDGFGKFERVYPHQFVDQFILADQSLQATDNPRQKLDVCIGRDPSTNQDFVQGCDLFVLLNPVPIQQTVCYTSLAKQQPTDRSPPLRTL